MKTIDILAKGEVQVCDWMGGDKRIEKMGYSLNNKYPVDETKKIIAHILDTTNFNIMIQRHGVGDIIIWIDDKRFRVR